MRPADIKTIRERSDFGRRARRPFIFWLAAVGALALAASAVHILFFADILRIQTVSISENGRISESSDGKAILAAINSVLEEKKIGFLKIAENILFFDRSATEKQLSEDLLFIKNVKINKLFPHGLAVEFSKKIPIGVWCFKDGGCRYFDAAGSMWGEAEKSSGFLLLSVDDLRNGGNTAKSAAVDAAFFMPLLKINEYLPAVNLKIKNAEIPENSLGEFKIFTDKNYFLFFDAGSTNSRQAGSTSSRQAGSTNSRQAGSDIAGQLESLKILLEERGKDTGFNPQYIDLRIGGRIYVK